MKLKIPSAMDFIKKLQADVRSKHFTTIEEAQAQNILSEFWFVEIIEALEKAEKYKWHDLRNNPEDLPTKKELYLVKRVVSDRFCPSEYAVLVFCDEKFWKEQYVIAWREIEPFEEVNE